MQPIPHTTRRTAGTPVTWHFDGPLKIVIVRVRDGALLSVTRLRNDFAGMPVDIQCTYIDASCIAAGYTLAGDTTMGGAL